MSEPLAYLNGRFLPQSQATLPLHDAGFVMGATVSDLCRTFHHRFFRWPDHLARFRRGLQATGIQPDLSDEQVTNLAHKLVEHNAGLLNKNQDLALVVFATPGPIGYYAGLPGGPGEGPPTLGIHTFPLPLKRYQRLFREGARLAVPTMVRDYSVDPRAKQRSRMQWWIAEHMAHEIDAGASALLPDVDECVTETATANFLVVKAGAIISPPANRILGGISLNVVREFCRELKIEFVEKPIPLTEAKRAEEVFLTSTPYCLAGVSRLDGADIPWPGPITQLLIAKWSEAINLDFVGQILAAR